MAYTQTQFEESIRLTLTGACLKAQLDETDEPIVTDLLLADTEYNIEGVDVLQLKSLQDFSFDVGNNRFYFSRSGAVDVPFSLVATLSFQFEQPNAALILRVTKNGTALTDLYTKLSTGVAAKNNEASMTGAFTLSENNYIELSVESDTVGEFSATSFSTAIQEQAQ